MYGAGRGSSCLSYMIGLIEQIMNYAASSQRGIKSERHPEINLCQICEYDTAGFYPYCCAYSMLSRRYRKHVARDRLHASYYFQANACILAFDVTRTSGIVQNIVNLVPCCVISRHPTRCVTPYGRPGHHLRSRWKSLGMSQTRKHAV